jgi:hypothetical protein
MAAFEAIPAHPGCPERKLDAVQDNQDVTKMSLVIKTGERRKIGLVGGHNHGLKTQRPERNLFSDNYSRYL